MAEITEDEPTEAAESSGYLRAVDRTILALEHAQDVISVVIAVLLAAVAAMVLVVGVVDFFKNVHLGAETAAVTLVDQGLLALILIEILHTVVLSLRAHRLVTQPLLAVGLVAVIRNILFVLSGNEQASTARLALLMGMIAVFVAALILVSRYDRTETEERH